MAVDLQNLNIDIDVSLSAAPVARAGFGKLLLMSPDSSPAGAALTEEFSTSAEIAAAVTAGTITARLATALNLALSQSPRPSVVKVGEMTAVPGAGTIAADIAAIRAVDTDWYGLYIDLEDEATVAAANATLAAAGVTVEALSEPPVLLFQGSNDPDMYNPAASTDPASVEQAAAHERSIVIYEQLVGASYDELQWGAYAHAASWLSFDPDVLSAVFARQTTGILPAQTTAATPADLTTAQINAIVAKKGNHFLAYASAPAFLNRGVNPVGRQVAELMSRDWVDARLREDIASAVVARSNLGAKWPLNNAGVALLANIVDARLAGGITAEHIQEASSTTGTFDTDDKSITVSARAQVLNSAVDFGVNVAFTVDSVNA